jgi:hypothetical protein
MILLNVVSIEAARGQDPQARAVIQGQVISRAGDPIVEAEVAVIGTPTTALTDSTGRFLLRGLAPGTTVIRVRRIGFKGQYLRVSLAPGALLTTEIMLNPGPQILPEITVTAKEAKPIEFAWTTKYDDFFRRRWLGLPGGTFISAEDIQRRGAIHTAELLEQYVPGARLILHFLGPGGTEIKFPRCSRASGYVAVWLDGRRMNWQSQYQQAPQHFLALPPGFSMDSTEQMKKARERDAELADVLDLIKPSEIQFMEVYRGIGSIPGEFSGGCGAVVIWTK